MKKLAGRAVLPLLALSLFAGCSPTGGTAAVVNGVAIPDSQVTGFAEGCSAVLQEIPQLAQTPSQLRPQAITWAVLGEMSRQQVAAAGAGPTDQQLRDYVTQAGLGVLLTDSRCAAAMMGLARHDIVGLTMGGDIGDYLESFEVEVNPRYGEWNMEDLRASGSGSLSQIAAG